METHGMEAEIEGWKKKGRGDDVEPERLGDSLGRGTGWKTSGLGVSRRKWRGFSSLLSSKTVSPVVPSSGFVRAPLSLHTIQSFFLPSAKTMRNCDLWSLVLSTPPRGSRGFTIVSCLCLIFSESLSYFPSRDPTSFSFFFLFPSSNKGGKRIPFIIRGWCIRFSSSSFSFFF